MHDLFRFLSNLIPAAVILLLVIFYYLHKRNVLRTKKEILLKEIEKGSIVDPEMLAKSLTNPISEEQRLQSNLRCGIIFSIAGLAVAIAAGFFCSYAQVQASEDGWNTGQMMSLTFAVTLVMAVAAIVLGVGIAYLVSYFNQRNG